MDDSVKHEAWKWVTDMFTLKLKVFIFLSIIWVQTVACYYICIDIYDPERMNFNFKSKISQIFVQIF